jgi:hypothetical protein
MIPNRVHLTLDLAAAATLGGAVWFAILSLLNVPGVAVAGGVLVFVGVGSGLVRLPSDVPAISSFAPAPLEFAEQEEEPLLLDRPIEIRPNSPLVRLHKPIPTPGELHHSIERHLEVQRFSARDDVEKLSEALAQLRQAIR